MLYKILNKKLSRLLFRFLWKKIESSVSDIVLTADKIIKYIELIVEG